MVVLAANSFFSLQVSPGGGSDALFRAVLPMILVFGIFYLLLFLPMQRQKKAQREMLASLQTGSIVQTTGGMIGTIVALDDDTLVLRIKPDNVRIQVARSAVAGVISEKT
jgi:preprotein translocase subunit YajC